MSDDGFSFEGLDDFKQQLTEVANEFPGTCEKHLRRVGNKMKKELKEASPDSGHDTKKKLNKSWKSEVQGYTGEDLQMNIWSNSPHFHLVDRGHVQKTKSGKVVCTGQAFSGKDSAAYGIGSAAGRNGKAVQRYQ